MIEVELPVKEREGVVAGDEMVGDGTVEGASRGGCFAWGQTRDSGLMDRDFSIRVMRSSILAFSRLARFARRTRSPNCRGDPILEAIKHWIGGGIQSILDESP